MSTTALNRKAKEYGLDPIINKGLIEALMSFQKTCKLAEKRYNETAKAKKIVKSQKVKPIKVEHVSSAVWTPATMKAELQQNYSWCHTGFKRLWERTVEFGGRDGMGFNRFDKPIAEQIKDYYDAGQPLQDWMKQWIQSSIPKYSRQLAEMANTKASKKVLV